MLSQASIDVNTFWDYWNKFKSMWSNLLNAGAELIGLQTKYEDLLERAQKVGDEDLSGKIGERLLQVTDDYSLWQEIKAKIDLWVPNWLKIEKESTGVESAASSEEHYFWGGFGILPALPAWAIAMLIAGGLTALVFIVNEGMKLLKRLYAERAIIADIERGVLTAEEAAKLISPEERQAGGGTLEKLTGLGTVAAVLVGALIVYNIVKKA